MHAISLKLIAAVTGIVVLFLLVSLAQEMNRRIQVQREVRQLETEVEQMRKSVIEVENLNRYFSTDAYQERLAREKLNYQAPGEKVVLIPEEEGTPNTPAVRDTTANQSIPQRWWHILFVSATPFDY